MAFDNLKTTVEARRNEHLTLADFTGPLPSDITTLSGDISKQVNHYLDDKTSLLAQATAALKGSGGITAALPIYDQAIAEAKTIDQTQVRAEMDAVQLRLKTETDKEARRILTQEAVDLDLLSRLPAIALANKGLAEKHHGIPQGQVDIDAAKALDPKMAGDRRFLDSDRHVALDLAAKPDDSTVGRHLNLPPNFNRTMSPFEQAKWLSQLPNNLSVTEKAEQDDLFQKAITASDGGNSRMLANANWDVNKAAAALRAKGVEPKEDTFKTQVDTLIGSLAEDKRSDASLKYYLYTRAINDTQRQQFRGELTALSPDFTKILDGYDSYFHLKPTGNAGGDPYFSWNLARQRVSNETNQAAITRLDYAEVLATRGDKAGAQKWIKDAIAHNHSKTLNMVLRSLAQAPEIGLAPADLDAITVNLNMAENDVVTAPDTTHRVVVASGQPVRTGTEGDQRGGVSTTRKDSVVTTGGEGVEELTQ